MPIVVTGAAGFVGRSAVAELCRRGREVVALDRSSGAPAPERGVQLVGDLLERDQLADTALATADAVIHLAGCPGVRDRGTEIAVRRARDNVAATARVLAAVPLDVPVIVASSSSVYGGSSGRPSRESDQLSPRGGYARSKTAVEQLCAARARAGGNVTVVRPFTVVGEGQRPDMAVARWLKCAASGRPLEVFGSLARTRDFTDVREVARILATLAEPGRAPGGVLNIGSGIRQALGDVVAAVSQVTGSRVQTVVSPAALVEPSDTWADTERLADVVGFVPQTDLLDVVRRAWLPAGDHAALVQEFAS